VPKASARRELSTHTRTRKFISTLIVATLLFVVTGALAAQESTTPAKPTYLTPSQRLQSAKTVYVKNAGGSSIPFDVINGAFEGWGRFLPADSAQKADLLVEVTSPEDSKTSTSQQTTIDVNGLPQQSVNTSHEIGDNRVRMVVRDAKSHIVLWSSSVPAKSALKKRSWNDNLVEAAENLMRQFHDRIEPPAAK